MAFMLDVKGQIKSLLIKSVKFLYLKTSPTKYMKINTPQKFCVYGTISLYYKQ